MNAVEFDEVSKNFALYDKPGDRLKELATFGHRGRGRTFPALTRVSFSAKKGEILCIIGENGSGKSTALGLMAGILQPTSGTVRVAGRVAALLELGSGFHPDFTGRENVYLNGTILGLSRPELDRRFAGIEEFAAIGSFIDQPVRTWSSGMILRLAFSVATAVDPEVLLVDEALAVGDAWFRHKCLRRVHELRERGVTIIFVSHALGEVRSIGERVLWLDHGRVAALGNPEEVVERYAAAVLGRIPRAVSRADPVSDADPVSRAARPCPPAGPERPSLLPPGSREPDSIPNIDHRHGDGRARITGLAVVNEFGEPLHLMTPLSRIVVRIRARASEVLENGALERPEIGFTLRNHLGLEFSRIATACGKFQQAGGPGLEPMRAGETVSVDFHLEVPELYPGSFSFSPWIRSEAGVCDWVDNAVTVQMARGESPVYGYMQVPCRVEMGSALV